LLINSNSKICNPAVNGLFLLHLIKESGSENIKLISEAYQLLNVNEASYNSEKMIAQAGMSKAIQDRRLEKWGGLVAITPYRLT